jgi:biotin carboxyl carrier protein
LHNPEKSKALNYNLYICRMFRANIGERTFLLVEEDSEFIIDGKKTNIDILEYSQGKFHILLGTHSYTAEVISFNRETKTFDIKVGQSILTVNLKDKYDDLLTEIGIDVIAGKKVNDIKAPMPGMVLHVMVENGQNIKKGDAIVVLEAMKMENILKSPADGVIKKVHVSMGDKVEKNQIMVNLD